MFHSSSPSDPFPGTWASVLLPIGADGNIDEPRLDAELDVLVASGVHGIYTNGTAGEFYAQSFDEYVWLSWKVAARCAAAGVPYQLGANFPTAQETLRRVMFAATLRPLAVQVTLPDWTPVSEAEALHYLQRLAEAAGGLPLVLYNPPHAKVVLEPAVLARLGSAVSVLVAVKTAWTNPAWLPLMRRLLPRLHIFVPGHLLAGERRRGASGSYSNVACLNPVVAAEWWKQMEESPAAALDLEQRLRKFMEQHIAPFRDVHGYSNQALDKLLAAVGDWADVGTRLRWPYMGVPDEAIGVVRQAARKLVPEFFPGIA